ncbi:MAG TPA: SIR2 family protein [Vicinamibacterales bacterium]|nr:SIR2 family protein [Vicinamibacterales bacterium]
MARLRDPERTRRNDGFGHIPYPILAQQFLRDQEQHLVPFLGAGASRPAAASAGESPSPIDPALLAELTARLSVTTDDAKMFLEIALAVLARLNAAPTAPRSGTYYDAIVASPSAPSAAELAMALAERANYDFFDSAKRRVCALTGHENWDDAKLTNLIAALARLTAIGSPSPPLLDASSYCSYQVAREIFWADLKKLFANKQEPTETSKLVAQAAANYIERNKDDIQSQDFLVITTNYDCLIEHALLTANVAHCVLTVPKSDPPSIELSFSPNAQAYLGLTDARFQKLVQNVSLEDGKPRATTMFSGLVNRPRPLVMLYKIHGSLHPASTQATDSVVITNEDYVTFLSIAGVVPSYITTRLPKVGLLFLGYSFSDWNVRSLYRSVTRYRAARSATTKDYAVLLNPSPYEVGFFEKNQIDVLDTPLDLFCQRMSQG